MDELEILFHDEHLVAINKPHGLMVHRSRMSANTHEFALQKVRNQIGKHVYPVHRLDRKTAGVLLFALSPEIAARLQEQFAGNVTKKTYHAIVRGWVKNSGETDYPLTNENGRVQVAVTAYRPLQHTEIDVPFGRYNTSRYTLMEIRPKTGRFHQIRKHFAHLRHPIVGDRPHGCNKQNKLFKQRWDMTTMMLHARLLEIVHPISQNIIRIEAEYQKEFIRTLSFLQFL